MDRLDAVGVNADDRKCPTLDDGQAPGLFGHPFWGLLCTANMKNQPKTGIQTLSERSPQDWEPLRQRFLGEALPRGWPIFQLMR